MKLAIERITTLRLAGSKKTYIWSSESDICSHTFQKVRKIIVRFRLIVYIVFTLSTLSAGAQSKKENVKQTEATTIGFKSKSEVSKPHSHIQKENKNDLQTTVDRQNTSLNTKKSETVQINNDFLPNDVRQKVNLNKANGQSLYEGVIKGYRLTLRECGSAAECNRLLTFLLEERNIISVEYRETQLFDIKVELQMKSEDLKALLIGKGITFSFINEYYLLR